MTDKKIKPVAGYKKSKEDFALEKLITPSSVPRTNEVKPVLNYKSIKTPDNNPFKRRKVDELPLEPTQRVDEEVSVVSEDECALLSSATSDNLISKSSNKRKLNEALTDQKDNAIEHISGVTQEEDLVLLELPPESQKSVNSKASSAIGRKRVVGKENKGKSNSSGIPKNSILNFFSRVLSCKFLS